MPSIKCIWLELQERINKKQEYVKWEPSDDHLKNQLRAY